MSAQHGPVELLVAAWPDTESANAATTTAEATTAEATTAPVGEPVSTVPGEEES